MVHVAQHEVQQEGLALTEGPGHRHDNHIQVLHVILQQDLLQRCGVQLKAVLILVGQHDLDGPRLLLLYCILETWVCNPSGFFSGIERHLSDYRGDEAVLVEERGNWKLQGWDQLIKREQKGAKGSKIPPTLSGLVHTYTSNYIHTRFSISELISIHAEILKMQITWSFTWIWLFTIDFIFQDKWWSGRHDCFSLNPVFFVFNFSYQNFFSCCFCPSFPLLYFDWMLVFRK